MLSCCFIFACLWLQGMLNIYVICLWVICIFSPGNLSSPPNTKLFNRKQHRQPAAWLCCHGSLERVFEVWVGSRLLLFPLIFLVLIIFLSSHVPPQPMSPSSLGHTPSISLHQAAVMAEPEIWEREREGPMRSKVVWRKTALVEKPTQCLPYANPSLPSDTSRGPWPKGGGHILPSPGGSVMNSPLLWV